MNKLTATVKQIDNIDNLYSLKLSLGIQTLKIVTLEPKSNINIDFIVNLFVKSTDISIAKNLTGLLSHSNQLNANILSINNGEILTAVTVKVEGFTMESIITKEASLKMSLSKGDNVLLLIQESDISLC